MFEMVDTLILLWVPGWRTWCTLIHDGGCVGYGLTLCNVYNKWEIVEIMGVANIA